MHAAMTPPPAAPPVAAAPAMPPPPQGPQALANASKKVGLEHLKLDKNPVVARTQLMQHLQTKYGPNYATHPEAKQMLDAFNSHNAGQDTSSLSAPTAASMKALLGHP